MRVIMRLPIMRGGVIMRGQGVIMKGKFIKRVIMRGRLDSVKRSVQRGP